jgi:DNA-binding MarR family transcriptional regulator
MAAKRPKSLKKRIDALVDALGGTKKPTLPEIRNQLVDFAVLAETLEDGQATAEKEATIAALEEENENLTIKLQMANAELETFQAERKKQEQEKKREEIPEIQFQILSLLPSEHGGNRLMVNEIARDIGIPVDEAEIHADRLKKAGLATWRHNALDAEVWYRTMRGNELVLAKRLAGEEKAGDRKPHKYADLPQIQHDALVMIAEATANGIDEGEIGQRLGKSLALTRHTLNLLRDARMATDAEEPGSAVCFSSEGDEDEWGPWKLLRKGAEYLAERDLL